MAPLLPNGTLLTVGLRGSLPIHRPGYFGGGLTFDLTASGDDAFTGRDATTGATIVFAEAMELVSRKFRPVVSNLGKNPNFLH